MKERIIREANLAPVIMQGYSRRFADKWYEAKKKDTKKYRGKYSKKTLRIAHSKGYLASTMDRYRITRDGLSKETLISDLDYLHLKPFNSSFSKWIDDIITSNYVLLEHRDMCRNVYYSIVQRNGQTLVLPIEPRATECTSEDILDLLKEKQQIELRPSHWKSKRARYQISLVDEKLLINGHAVDKKLFSDLVLALKANYVVADPVSIQYPNAHKVDVDHIIKFWLANDTDDGFPILEAEINFYYDQNEIVKGSFVHRRKRKGFLIDPVDGRFEIDGDAYYVPEWSSIIEKICGVCNSLKQLTYFTMSVALQPNSEVKIVYFDSNPILPSVRFGDRLNNYLIDKANIRKAKILTAKERINEIKNILIDKFVLHFARKGIRPYMQRIWDSAIKDDLLHTKGATLKEKIWCWKRGFYSYRLWQYGINENNYKEFLSDYDYLWLNRINGDYQKWVNDKTTYRYAMDSCKEYVPKYYFSVFKRNGNAEIARMPDCPDDISADFEAVIDLLKRERKLAFKASAGTHGDGFYCLAYDYDKYFVNGKESTESEVIDVLKGQSSSYIITEYVVMHEYLRNIYPESVNTIRVMVVNEHGYDPKIMQTYMRIGSSKTGFTDNVGYGGICAKIEKETGKLYKPQTIAAHRFYDCPTHPDSNVKIEGYLPNWDVLRKSVLEIARQLGELEYLGFDVVLTETGICVIEINIHQDLHQIADATDEMKSFFQKKIHNKMKQYKILEEEYV